MDFLESEMLEKENQIYFQTYENAIYDIECGFLMESADIEESSPSGLQKLANTVKSKIQEIIEKIRRFFANLYETHKVNKLKKQMASALAKSNQLVSKKIDTKRVLSNMDKAYKAQQNALNHMKHVYEAYKKDAITYDQFVKKTTDIQKKLSDEMSGYKDDSKTAVMTLPREQAIPMKNITDQMSQILNEYERKITAMQKEIIGYEEDLKKTNDEKNQKIASAKMKISSIASKISMDAVAVIGVCLFVGGLFYMDKRANAKLEETYKDAEEKHGKEFADHLRYENYARHAMDYNNYNIRRLEATLSRLQNQYIMAVTRGDETNKKKLKSQIKDVEKALKMEERRASKIKVMSEEEWKRKRSK